MLPPRSYSSLYHDFTRTAALWGNGYDKEKNVYLVSDPLVGLVERDMEDFAAIYNEIGKYAVVIY